jgi:hypothetical protein
VLPGVTKVVEDNGTVTGTLIRHISGLRKPQED